VLDHNKMGETLRKLSEQRKASYYKNPEEENFLLRINKLLQQQEIQTYKEVEIKYPFLFVFGLPRSGTTLLSQLIAHSFDIGYINNIAARFWLAPVYGIKLSDTIIGSAKQSDFRSHYARTANVSDIHEFGYFWRYWLKKEKIEEIIASKQMESQIDWVGLKRTLANVQSEFNKPMVFKNIFGSYHMRF